MSLCGKVLLGRFLGRFFMRKHKKPSPCQTEPVPDGSKINLPVAKSEPTSKMVTYSRRLKRLCSSCEREDWGNVWGNHPADTRAKEQGVLRFQSRFPCSMQFKSRWGSCATETCEEPHIWASGYSLNRAVEPGESLQKQVPVRTSGSWGTCAWAACSWRTASWGKDPFWSSSWRTESHGKDPCWSTHDEVSPKGRTPHWNRGRALLERKEKHRQCVMNWLQPLLPCSTCGQEVKKLGIMLSQGRTLEG